MFGALTAAPSAARARRPLLHVAAAVSIFVVGVSVAVEQIPNMTSIREHLGAEYYNIGLALADGRGFSDPFGETTGPTAWMGPLYPTLLALLIELLGSKNLVAAAVLTFMNVTVVVIATTLYAMARRFGRRVPPALAVGFFLLWTCVFYCWFFLLTSDTWLLSLLTNFLVLAICDCLSTGRVRPWAWGAIGGAAALSSPTLFFAWVAVAAVFLLRDARHRRRWLLGIALAAAIATPWVIRNQLVFDRFVPTKSNAAFEAHQANVIDPDGIYDVATMLLHPFNRPEMRFEYAVRGESAYLDGYSRSFGRFLRGNPGVFARKVGNRLLAATVQYVPLTAAMEGPLESTLKRSLYPVPFLILVTAACMRGPHRLLIGTLALAYAVYLLPYIGVAFYMRYLIPMTPLLCLLVYLGVDQLALRWLPRRSTAA